MVSAYYHYLDTWTVPPFLFKTWDSWADLYNHTFKQYMKLRANGTLDSREAHKLLYQMMNHVILNPEPYRT